MDKMKKEIFATWRTGSAMIYSSHDTLKEAQEYALATDPANLWAGTYQEWADFNAPREIIKEITEEQADEARNVLPPIYRPGCFFMGEEIIDGWFYQYVGRGGRYFMRPAKLRDESTWITAEEIKKEIKRQEDWKPFHEWMKDCPPVNCDQCTRSDECNSLWSGDLSDVPMASALAKHEAEN